MIWEVKEKNSDQGKKNDHLWEEVIGRMIQWPIWLKYISGWGIYEISSQFLSIYKPNSGNKAVLKTIAHGNFKKK